MFLTRQSVSLSVCQSVSPVVLVSATPLKPRNRISWIVLIMKDMCRCAYLIQFFVSESALFELRNLTKMNDTTDWVFFSATPLKPLNRIAWNFVVIMDIKVLMCISTFWFKFFLTINGGRMKFLLLYVEWKNSCFI